MSYYYGTQLGINRVIIIVYSILLFDLHIHASSHEFGGKIIIYWA